MLLIKKKTFKETKTNLHNDAAGRMTLSIQHLYAFRTETG